MGSWFLLVLVTEWGMASFEDRVFKLDACKKAGEVATQNFTGNKRYFKYTCVPIP